jgi:hypothetical protein
MEELASTESELRNTWWEALFLMMVQVGAAEASGSA